MTLADLPVIPTPSTPADEKEFSPGSMGWSASDLDDPRIERLWMLGRYEIIEGVVAIMPAAYYSGGVSLLNLVDLVKQHLRLQGVRGGFAPEADIIIDESRVLRAAAAYLDLEARSKQKAAALAAGRVDPNRRRILVPPTLIIESISPGHEAHDRKTKRRWYAEFGVPHYWILDVFARSLQCLALEDRAYRDDATGSNADVLRPSAFPGLVLPLNDVWED